MRVAKWGNSLAVRLPKELVDELGLVEGDEIAIERATREFVLVAREPSVSDHIDALRQFRGLKPKDFRFDREEANER